MFWVEKEPSHRDGSFEYPQHVFGLRKKKIIFSYPLLSGGLNEHDEFILYNEQAFSFKSVYQKNNFLISQPKHMLWDRVLKRTVKIKTDR